MSTAETSARRQIADGFLIDTNNASMGGFTRIDAAAPVALQIDPVFGTFDRFYYIYYINTDVSVTIVLPATTNITRGWGCRVILNSPASTGSVVVNTSTGVLLATIQAQATASVVKPKICIDINSAKGSAQSWSVNYYLYDVTESRRFTLNLAKALIPASLTLGNFSAYSGTVGSTISLNTTTVTPIPWSTTRPGYYVDNIYMTHSAVNPSRISVPINTFLLIKVLLFINNTGGATVVNLIRIRVNGATFQSCEANVGTISSSASTSVILTCQALISTGYFEVVANKSAVSGGTNLLDRGNTVIHVQALFNL